MGVEEAIQSQLCACEPLSGRNYLSHEQEAYKVDFKFVSDTSVTKKLRN